MCVCVSATPPADPRVHHPPACPPAASQAWTEGCLDTAGGQADQWPLWFGPDGRIIHHLALLAGNPAKMTGI